MLTHEYDASGRLTPSCEESNDFSTQTPAQKAQAARQTFVERVQVFYGACMTEMSQGSALRRRRAEVSTLKRHEFRIGQESRPTLAEWFKLKQHVERHFYMSGSWALPSRAFVHWVAGLIPYLRQGALREELRAVMQEMVSSRKLQLKGNALSQSASNRIRHALARRLGLKGSMLDAQKAELHQLQREVYVELYKAQLEEQRAELIETALIGSAGQVASAVDTTPPADEEQFTDARFAMRKMVMDLQGSQYGKLTPAQKEAERKNSRHTTMNKELDDDYLAGPLSVESYVVFRARPLMERYEKQVMHLSRKVQLYDILGLLVNALGAVLAALDFTEWVTLTVAIVATLAAIIDFTQLRNHVIANNLALRDLQNMMVWWDSLPLTSRRNIVTTSQVVDITERGVMQVVDAYTTAASQHAEERREGARQLWLKRRETVGSQ